MGRILKPMVRGGGWYPSKKWIPLVRNGGYTTQNGGETEPVWATASGAIASFTTSLAYPLKKLVAQINPVQDLHGYDAPWPAGGGKNKFYLWKNGYINSEGGFTPQANNGCAGKVFVNEGETWTFSAVNRGTNTTFMRGRFFDANDNMLEAYLAQDNTLTVTVPSGAVSIIFYFSVDGYTETITQEFCDTLGIQIEKSSTPSTFAPYSNLCPISGWTGLQGQRTGANLFDKTTITDNAYVNGAGVVISNTEFFCSDYISVKPETSYYIYTDINGRMDTIRFYDANKAVIGGSAYQKRVVTTPANCHYIRINAIKSHVSADEVFFNYPSTDTSYHAYTGEPISVSFGTTVYGGTDEVVSGNGTSTMGMVDLGTLSWEYASSAQQFRATVSGIKTYPSYHTTIDCICEMFKVGTVNSSPQSNAELVQTINSDKIRVRLDNTTLEEFRSIVNGKKLVYALATPTTFTHSPQEVDTLVGQNNIWVTSGDVEVTYRIE